MPVATGQEQVALALIPDQREGDHESSNSSNPGRGGSALTTPRHGRGGRVRVYASRRRPSRFLPAALAGGGMV